MCIRDRSTAGNVTGGNLVTTGNVYANYIYGNIEQLTGNLSLGNVSANGIISATGTITGNTTIAFAAGPAAQNQVALGYYSSAANVGANMAIRDFSNVASTMYFDAAVGGNTSGNSQFQFRAGNTYTLSLIHISEPTRPY